MTRRCWGQISLLGASDIVITTKYLLPRCCCYLIDVQDRVKVGLERRRRAGQWRQACLAEEVEGKVPGGAGSTSRFLGVSQSAVGILLLSKPQFGSMEMGLSRWERRKRCSHALLRVHGSYDSVDPDAFYSCRLWRVPFLVCMEGTTARMCI